MARMPFFLIPVNKNMDVIEKKYVHIYLYIYVKFTSLYDRR